jgi:hypothetical protein
MIGTTEIDTEAKVTDIDRHLDRWTKAVHASAGFALFQTMLNID